jgi:thiamine biosynthesis lipoprotein
LEKKARRLTYLPHILLCAVLLALVGGIIWFYNGEYKTETPYTCVNAAMGTYVQQTVYGENGESAAANAAAAVGELEDLISWRVEDSDVYKLNENAGVDWTVIDKRTMTLLRQCLDVAQQSGGAFDPTILPISSLWGFGGDSPRLPGAEEIAARLPFVDYHNLRLDEEESSASLKNRSFALDLGAAGKGAACDAAVLAYEQANVRAGIVAVGGSIGIYGQKKEGQMWKVAIRDPLLPLLDEESSSMGTLTVEGGFLSTSGVYEKYVEVSGQTYHHILDPKTGYPVENDLLSVTVYAESGAMSDILSTACFVLGREESLPLLQHYGAEAVFIDRDQNVYVTDGLKDRLEVTHEGYTLHAW